jgi:hypothetical protein
MWTRCYSSVTGNLLWDKRELFDSISATGPTVGFHYNVTLSNDSNYLVTGYNKDSTSTGGAYLRKYDYPSSNLLWSYSLLNEDSLGLFLGNTSINKTIAVGDGYMIFGRTFDRDGYLGPYYVWPLIAKIDENGNELWRKQIFIPQFKSATDTYWAEINDAVKTNDKGFALIGYYNNNLTSNDVFFMKVTCNGDTAAPQSHFTPVVNIINDSIVQIHNESQYFDTCIFKFSDGSPDVIKLWNDTTSFTHHFPGHASNYGISCIANACGNEKDSSGFTNIITSNYDVNAKLNYLFAPYPNPTNSTVTLKYFLPENTTKGNIQILNTNSEIVFEKEIFSTKGETNLNLNNLPNNVYIIRLLGNKEVLGSRRIIVNH